MPLRMDYNTSRTRIYIRLKPLNHRDGKGLCYGMGWRTGEYSNMASGEPEIMAPHIPFTHRQESTEGQPTDWDTNSGGNTYRR